ncbi:MAG: Kae1-associated serine/threonine protein kinase [Candidatus Thorarchaeota archaeon]|nr:MAG: Kae1-associated serine/threonine protein kinase [Candidatus Thorarchaeota archaeon]
MRPIELSIGAESTIYKVERWGKEFALKWRHKKPYLHPEIDRQLRTARTTRECRMLNFARLNGITTPTIHAVDLTENTIMMDYIKGEQLKQLVPVISSKRLRSLCFDFGRTLAKLHNSNVVHGDPTTSNFIVDSHDDLWVLDFGLAEWNATAEMKGVDLHLVRRVLETTHWDVQEAMLEATLKGYVSTIGDEAEHILSRMEEIRERGRYH